MIYSVPEYLNKNRIFIVNKSKLENRLDAQYYSVDLVLFGFEKL